MMGKVKLEQGTGPVPILAAYPVVLVGSQVSGKPDFATVAWTGVAASNPPTISVALQHHRYSLKGIRQNMAFSVNIPSADLIKETDYCGMVSGAKFDKVKDCGFQVFYGKSESAPLIEQCPINHACEVVQILDLGSHELIIGRILETYVSEECMTDGRTDDKKVNPIFFTYGKYSLLGKGVGDAFHVGRSINPKAKIDVPQIPGRGRGMGKTRNARA
jgi:flavin reductase (DIM6/NTAB) family NADH-FMN oxidoreductase RutF